MKEKIATLKPKGISQQQWGNFLLELTEYHDAINRHVMKDGSGYFFGCIMR